MKDDKRPMYDIPNREGIIIEELTATEVDLGAIKSTYSTTKIEMITDDIEIFRNHQGVDTPILILARAKMEGGEYAALFDTNTKMGYVVAVVRVNGIIKEFKDIDGLWSDEEWAVINEFFQQNNVFATNRIFQWTWNSSLNPKLNNHIPKHVLERWNLDPNTKRKRRR
jgi:hypothetical protein